MTANAEFVFHPDETGYKFNEDHPFNPERLTLAIDLLQKAGALQPHQGTVYAPASADLLALVHREDYVEAVKALSAARPDFGLIKDAERYGLGTEDTPYFPGMHDAASLIVGGSIMAAETVMSGKALHAYHMGGGLHHAFPERGSGFCVYNDAAVAIAEIRRRYGAKVLYIDTDVHHGDGVQWSFYADPDVFTYSIHETGKFLFPGTGFVHERGTAEGFGATCNVPMEPYTEDESWLECFRETVERAARAFQPDVIVSQHGCDAHAFDPLSHIHCSMRIYSEMPAVIHDLAHRYTGGKWIALGGGGYDIWRVVPRAWALVWLEMTDHPIARRLRAGENELPLPESWLQKWAPISPYPLPATWLDDPSGWEPMPRRKEITSKNRSIKETATQDL
jgi:acetoin utilization protein AcuC